MNSFQPFLLQRAQHSQTNYSSQSQFYPSYFIAFVKITNFFEAEENYFIFPKNNTSVDKLKKEQEKLQQNQIFIQSIQSSNLSHNVRTNIRQHQQNKLQHLNQRKQQQTVKKEQKQQQFNFYDGQKQKIKHTYRYPHLKRPFICDLCGIGLTSQTILNHHIKETHGEKTQQCPTCPYMTSTQLRLTKHSCKVQGQECPLCKKRNINMSKHNYNFHKSHTCLKCGQVFIGYNELRKHDLSKHRVEKRLKKKRTK